MVMLWFCKDFRQIRCLSSVADADRLFADGGEASGENYCIGNTAAVNSGTRKFAKDISALVE